VRVRAAQSPNRLEYLARLTLGVLRRPKLQRNQLDVLQEYTEGWSAYRNHLQHARVLEEWLSISGVDGGADFYNVDGKLSYQHFNSAEFYRRCLLDALKVHFPQLRSITEFGCGVGRNLLFLKLEMPHVICQGYELCTPGVELGRVAADKFGLSVQYAQLDFVNDPPEKYVLPKSDVAFTMFALEQIPRDVSRGLKNILDHVRMGAIHIEPVTENYPLTLRGIVGRIDHWKVDYLQAFDRSVRALENIGVVVEPVRSAHNPLMFPSLYVLRKG
jgi:hypothetical protein